MTREIRHPADTDKDRRVKYIDHGHLVRKAVYYGLVMPAVMPLALIQWSADKLVTLLDELVSKRVSRLYTWAHPCLYGRPGESHEDYLRRSGTYKTGKPPTVQPIKLNPNWPDSPPG